MNLSAKARLWRSQPALLMLAGLAREQRYLAGVLLSAGVLRCLPASLLTGLDQLLGRPGDTLLLLVLLSIPVWFLLMRSTSQAGQNQVLQQALVADPITQLLDRHLHLDKEIDHKLTEVIDDTESSALEIMSNVRKLFDTASELVAYLNRTSIKGSSLEQEIGNSVASILDIGTFVARMPEKIERDLSNVNNIVAEINGLGGLVQAVREISMQSHLLAINASIEAARAGKTGAAFRAVADEMRALATNSGNVAKQINEGLTRTQYVLNHGIAADIQSSVEELRHVTRAVDSIQKIKDNFEDISQYYKTSFMVVNKHNVDLASRIGDVLGSIQYQDVVRQCVDRIRFAIGRRNMLLKSAVDSIETESSAQELLDLPALLEMIRIEYLAEENKHKHSARHALEGCTELKIELF